ncbi:MAG TPA: Hsp20/alpha crystallin family protein [Azonexus sp.]|nr:Hsp20/alpha crystallin family protein [Azonexus sp.]
MTNDTKQEVDVSKKPRTEIAEVQRPMPVAGALEEVERLFDRLMPRSWMSPMAAWNWPMWGGLEESLENIRAPQMDVIDRDKDILIRVEMPGVEKKNVDVSVSDGTLSIKGSVQRESKEQRKDYFRCEIAQGNFSRSLAIPGGIDKTNISASLKDGILEVTLPKEEGAQRRAVEVK